MPAQNAIYNVVHGWPDDRRVTASVDDSGQFSLTRPGTPSFSEQIAAVRQVADVWLGPGTPAECHFTARPTVNYIADPDLCRLALQAAANLSTSIPVPWFNHPRAVLNNTRDKVSQVLQGVPGVIVPRTIRLAAPTRHEIADAVTARGIGYPAIVRIAGLHNGKGTVLLRGADDLQQLDTIPWGGRDLYLSHYVDCAAPDGKYRKHRIVVVGGQPLLRHIAISPVWLVNTQNRLLTPDSIAEELALSAEFETRFLPRVIQPIREIHRRLALDYFGIDCCLRRDGSMVLFEANPNMQTTRNVMASPNIWDRPIERIREALKTLLDHPEQWVFGAPAG